MMDFIKVWDDNGIFIQKQVKLMHHSLEKWILNPFSLRLKVNIMERFQQYSSQEVYLIKFWKYFVCI